MPDISVNIEQKIFRRKDDELCLLGDVNFVAKAGAVTVILGESGCGKSTLLRLLAGLDNDFRGSVSGIDGKQSIGMVFQDTRLLHWKTVRENIRFASVVSKNNESDIDRLLELVHLEGNDKVFPKDLSGGMGQRVALARALVNNPEVILLDEPFSSLDSFTRNTLQEELLQITKQEGITCIFVTHDLDEAVFLADTVILLSANHANHSLTDKVRLSRPRDRLSLAFASEKARIADHLRKLTGRKIF